MSDILSDREAVIFYAEQRGYASAMEAERKLHEAHIEAQAAEIEWYRDRVVWGFYEDETPKFYQGKEGEHEICEPVSAKEVSNYISEIERLQAKLAKAVEALRMIENIELTFLDECRDIARTTLAELKGGKP